MSKQLDKLQREIKDTWDYTLNDQIDDLVIYCSSLEDEIDELKDEVEKLENELIDLKTK